MSKKSNKLLNQLERELQNLPDELFIDEEGKWKDLKNKDYFKQKNLNLAMMSEDVDADMFDIGMEENDPADEKDDGGDLDESGNKLEARKKKSRRGKSLYVPRGRGGRVIRGSRGSIYRKFISERGGRGGRGRERFEPRSRFEEHRRDSHFKERDEHHFSRRQNYSGSRREEHSSSRRDEKERQILNESIPIDTSHTFGKPSSSQDERPPQETKRYSHEADLMCLFDQLNAQLGIGGNRPSSPEMRRVIIEKTIESDMRAREDSEGVRGRWDMVSGPPTSRISVERRSKSPPRMGSHFDQEILERELSPKMIARLRDLSPDLRERFIQEIRKTTQSQYPHYDQSPQDNSLRLNSPDVRAQYERDVWGRSDSLEPCVRYAQDSRDMVHFSRGDSSQSPSRFDDNPRNRTDSPERSRFNEGLQNRERSPRMDSPRARSYLEQNARSRDKSPRMDYIASRPHFDQVSRNRDSSPRMDSPMRRKMYDQEHNRGHSPNSWSRFDDKSRFRENVQRQLSPDSQTRFVQISRHRDHSPRAGSPGARPHFEHEPRSSDRSPRIDFQGGRSHGDQERKSREISPIFERLIRDSEFPPGVSTPPTHPSIKQQRSVSPTLKAHKDKGDIRNSELRSRHRVQSPPKDMHYSGREYGNRSPTQRGSSLEKRYGDYHSSRKRSNSKDSPISLLSSPENKISKWNTDSNIPLEEFPHHARPGTFPAQPGSLQVPASQPQPSEQPQQQSTLQQSIVNSYPQAGYIPPPGTDIPPYSASSYPPSNYGQYPTSYISNPNNNFINYPPPSFPITQPPLSTVQDYPSSMNWADPNPPSIVTPLPGVPSPQDVPSAKSAEESKKEAIEKEQKQQKQTLLKQREEYVRKSSSLQHELELLRNQKRELLEEKSSDNGHILKENQKLQTEIQNKLKAIANVIDMLTGIIGDKDSDGKKSSSKTNNNKPKTSKDSPKSSTQRKPVARSLDNPPPPGVSIDRIPVVILDKPAEPVPTGHPGELHETLSEQKSSENTAGKAVFNYVHYDPEMHWCRVCNVFPKTAKEYLNHLHSSEHKTQTLEKKLIDMPWHQTQKIDEPAHNKGAPTKRVPIRGLQFFISATAWYCKLCDVWIGDLHCASNHLKSTLHSQKYATFAQKNPHWEVDWLADRSHAYEHAAEETRRLKRNVSVNKQATSSSKESQLLSQKDVKSHSSNSNASKSLSEQLIAALKERNIRSSKEEPKTKKKSSSSSSSSTSSSSSDSDDNKKHSIRVAMRNKDNIPSKVPNKDSKETEVPKVKSKWDSPERDNDKSSTNKDKEKPVASSSDDKMLQEWMEVSAPDKDRDMINNLKDRLKHKQQEIDREIEKRREMEKMKYMKESRDRRRDSRWDGSRNSRRDHYDKDSRSSRRSDRTPEKQRERKTSAGKEHDKSDKQSSKNVKGSEPVTGRSSGKLEKPTGGRQIWVPGSDDSDLEENGQSNFEKQLTESVAKKKDSQSAQKSVPKPRLPFIGRMPFIGKFPTTKRKSEDSIVEDPKKDEKPNEENSSKKISDKTVLIWPDIPKLSDKPQIHTESSKKDTNKTKTTTVDSELPKTTKSTSKVVSISSAPVPVETKTVPIVLKTVPAVMPKSTLLLSKTPLLSGPSLPKKKKKSKRKVIDNAGGVEDMDLDDDDDNDGTDKQNLPKDFQDALDILFPSDNPEGQPAASEILTGETVAAMNPQPVTEIIAAPLINTPNTGSLGNHPLHTENMIHQNPINENIIMPGQINLHVAMDPVNIGPPVVLDMPINPPIPMGTGPMGPPGPIDNRIRPPRPMFRMGPPGPMEGRMGPPGPMHGRMRPPGMMGPPGPMDGRMRPPRPMDGRMGPPEIINEEMGMHGPMGVRMGPPGPMGGRMGPHGPMGSRMRPPGPMVGMMRPPGPRGGIMGPPGPMSGRMGPLGHMDEEMGPPGPMDYDMSYGPEGDFDNMEFGPGGEFMEYGPEEGMGPQRPPGTSDSLFKKKNPPSQKKRNQLKKRRDELTAKEQELKQKIKEQAELIAKKEKDKKKAELDELAMLGIDSEDMAAQSF